MSFEHLPEEQARRAREIYESILAAAQADLMALAELLAGKPDGELFGDTEFEVRDRVQRIGAMALQTAASRRKKRGM